MPTYITITSQNTIDQWPLHEHDIRAAHPHTSFPQPLQPEDVADIGYVPVQPTPVPTHDADTQTVTEVQPMFDAQAADGAGVWLQTWEVTDLPAETVAASLSALKTHTKRQVDAEVDAVTTAVVGQRAQEYLEAERQAADYIAAGYTGTLPEYVAADADAYLQTARWSADRIASTAAAWKEAQLAMRIHRLRAKAQVAESTTHAQVRAALALWAQALGTIKIDLGI